jgi:hypothetical protein
MQPERVQATMKALAWGAGIVGGLLVANKTIGLVRSTAATIGYIRNGKTGGAAAAAAGAAGAAAGGAMPVMVMNWPAGGLGAVAGAAEGLGEGGGKSATGKLAARGGRWGRMLGRAGGVLGRTGGLIGRGNAALALVTGGVDVATSLASGDTRGAVGAGGRTGGALAGAALGAAAGSIVPVIGTAIGGIVGGMAGAFGGEALFKGIYDWLSKDAQKKDEPAKVQGAMRLDVRLADGIQGSVSGLSSTPGLDMDVGMTTSGAM